MSHSEGSPYHQPHKDEGEVYGVGEIVIGATAPNGICTICGSPVVDIKVHIRFHRMLGHVIEDRTKAGNI